MLAAAQAAQKCVKCWPLKPTWLAAAQAAQKKEGDPLKLAIQLAAAQAAQKTIRMKHYPGG